MRMLERCISKLRVGGLIIRTSVPVGQLDTVLFRLRLHNVMHPSTNDVCQFVNWWR